MPNKLKQTVIAYIYDYTLIITYLLKNIDYIPELVKSLKDRTPASKASNKVIEKKKSSIHEKISKFHEIFSPKMRSEIISDKLLTTFTQGFNGSNFASCKITLKKEYNHLLLNGRII